MLCLKFNKLYLPTYQAMFGALIYVSFVLSERLGGTRAGVLCKQSDEQEGSWRPGKRGSEVLRQLENIDCNQRARFPGGYGVLL